MSDIEEFIAAPSVQALDKCSRDQLLLLANHYNVVVTCDKRLKESIKAAVKEKLVETGVFSPGVQAPLVAPLAAPTVAVSAQAPGLTFEQQKELLLIQLEFDKQKHELETRKQIELEALRQGTEKAKLELEGRRLSEGLSERASASVRAFDIGNLRLVPQFNDRDPEAFFVLFERVARAREWSDADCALMLQCVLTGRAQEAFSSMSLADSSDYKNIKSAVLRAYELVPEAYRQRFRSWEKRAGQTYVEFARDLTTHFKRWLTALDVTGFDDLCDLVILEQFKNVLPGRLVTHINDREVTTAAEAAVAADEFVLLHKGSFRERTAVREDFAHRENFVAASGDQGRQWKSGPFKSEPKSHRFDKVKNCNYCHEPGHWKAECPVLHARSKPGRSGVKPAAAAAPVPAGVGEVVSAGVCESDVLAAYFPFIRDGFVSLAGSEAKVPVKILRDTGAYDSYMVESVLPLSEETDTGDRILSRGMGLTILPIPLHKVTLNCELVQGEVAVGVRPALPIEGVHFILGNGLAGSRVWADTKPVASICPGKVDTVPSPVVTLCPVEDVPGVGLSAVAEVSSSCAVTRAMRKAESEETPDLELPSLSDFPLYVSRSELMKEQQGDPSLKGILERVLSATEIDSAASGYVVKDGVLFRKWLSLDNDSVGDAVFQLVVPEKFRSLVLKVAHDESGHFGVRKTYLNILKHFFWPRVKRDVSAYIKTCHVCQLTGKPNQGIKPAPLQPIPAVSEPFAHLIIDCVGPLPSAKSGCKYLLTVMCQSTRYPAAYPLRSITTKNVVKALTQFISVFGIPKVVQSDQGSNFSAHMFAQVLKLLRVKHSQSSAYHAQSQGALERFHQTLKALLRAYCTELDKDWEEGLPWLMLAAREAVQESTGFSPNELVFGHKVRGPLAVLKDDWVEAEPPKNLVDFVNGFRHRLFVAGGMARERLHTAQGKMKKLYDRRSGRQEFSPGDRVLALMPIVGSPFQAKYSGPYTVTDKLSELNYLIATPGRRKSKQLVHVNLLKPYYGRVADVEQSGVRPALGVNSLSVMHDGDGVPEPDDSVLCGRLKNSESLSNLDRLLCHLPESKRSELVELVHKYPGLFGDVPSRTGWAEHDIDVGDARPIKQRFYRTSPEKVKYLDSEVSYMLDNNIAVPSSSSWASPCILVPKPDKTPRFCTDMRKVNSVTKSDSFPLPRMDDCIDRVGSAKFVSKFDLLKGYWQVPLSKRAQEIAAFITPTGLYSYTVMPFGLKNAPATFQRLMNRVVSGLEGCSVYLDDLVIYSDTWHSHLQRIRALFDRLAEAHLTINLAKCEFAMATVTYLGHVVGQGCVAPVQAKVLAVEKYPQPTTKKELQRFLGLVGYYRSFCKNFSTVVFPLTELLKAKAHFEWSPECQQAFENVKCLLCSSPVLAAPRFDRTFVLQVDASQVGAGAVLLQEDDQRVVRPVSYFSRKFNRHQVNYSVIEKEALSLILSLQHFEVYVTGGAPLVVYTDHNPLTFLQSLRCPNQRLVRWALFLQAYDLDIRHIRGTENIMADALSRAPLPATVS